MSKPGGMKQPKPADAESITIANKARGEIEAKVGRSFTTFNPVEYATQTVAGTNYFIKIDVGGEYVHARIFKDLKQNVSLHSVQAGKTAADPIEYF